MLLSSQLNQDNDSQLKSYLIALRSNHLNINLLLSVISKFKKITQSTQYVEVNRKDCAMIFCELLHGCKLVYISDNEILVPRSVQQDLLDTYINIQRLYIGEEYDDSYIRVMWFLNQLHLNAKNATNISSTNLSNIAEDLLDILDDIQAVFDFKVESEYFFPINKLISTVIKNSNFLTQETITKENIKILRLAVRLFKNNDDKDVFLKFKSNYNLQFINYLTNDCSIIDTNEFNNYQENGVIIFFNPRLKKVLVRSDREDYFKEHLIENFIPQSERNYNNHEIGWFIEYELRCNDHIESYSSILASTQNRKLFLELLFDKHCYNIFLDNSIVFSNGELKPINPYCRFDKKIITNKRIKLKAKKSFLSASENIVSEILKEYWISPVSEDCTVNNINFGLCLLLLSINNIGIEALDLDSLDYTKCLQNQVIDKWIKADSTNLEHIITLLNIWYDDLRYFDDDLSSVIIRPIRFLPYKYPLKNIFRKFKINLYKDENIFTGTVIKDESALFIEYKNLPQNKSSSISQETRLETTARLSIDKFKFCGNYDSLIEFENKDFWFSFSLSENKGHLFSSSFYKSIYYLNPILDKLLSYTLCRRLSLKEYESLVNCMMLYSESFEEIGSKYRLGSDLKAQCCIRLLHNLIWSNISKTNQLTNYFEIIGKHQLADFDGITEDKLFRLNKKNTLYIPKDSFEISSVLSDIYIHDFRAINSRDDCNIYHQNLKKKDDKYYINGEIIKEIILLTDNFTDGASTIDAISAYFDLELETENKKWKQESYKEKIQKYFCEGALVSIKEILDKNGATFKVHSFYGTKNGCKFIDSFIRKHIHDTSEMEIVKYSNLLRLESVADKKIISKAKRIWKKSSLRIKEGQYLFIRKYSMPKSFIFPSNMLGNGENPITLFILRKELKEKK